MVSRWVHSSYRRQLADTAAGGREVLIDLQARRFFCGNPGCGKTTFAEQVPGPTVRYGRRTCSLQAVLQAVALALGGRADARLTGKLACAVSRSTLLRLIRAAADPDDGTPLVLGVAFRAAQGARLWHRPGRHRDPRAGRHAGRAVRRVFPRLAGRPPGRRDHLPGSRRVLCRRRRRGCAAGHPGRRPVAMRHEAPGCIPGSAGRNSEGGSWVRWLTWI